jgi:hypothetical protein
MSPALIGFDLRDLTWMLERAQQQHKDAAQQWADAVAEARQCEARKAALGGIIHALSDALAHLKQLDAMLNPVADPTLEMVAELVNTDPDVRALIANGSRVHHG